MTANEKLAQFILNQKEPNHDVMAWHRFQSTCPKVRVKTVGPNEDVLINLSGVTGWIKPTDWLANYQANCIQAYQNELSRLANVLPQEKLSIVTGSRRVQEQQVNREFISDDDYQSIKEFVHDMFANTTEFYFNVIELCCSKGRFTDYQVADLRRALTIEVQKRRQSPNRTQSR